MDPKFLNTLKGPLIEYHYDKPSTLYKRICRRRSIWQNFIKWAIGPTWDLGPKIPGHPKWPTTQGTLCPSFKQIHQNMWEEQTDRQTETDRRRDRQIDRQTDRIN